MTVRVSCVSQFCFTSAPRSLMNSVTDWLSPSVTRAVWLRSAES